MYFIYKHTNIVNNKVYIGQTCQQPNRRFGRNGINYIKYNTYFGRAIQKYGWDSFEHQIIQTTDTKEKADILEKMWISFYRKRNGVYNLSDGGEGNTGYIMSEEAKLKISKAKKGKTHIGVPHTEEAKLKMSNAKKGKTPWNKGKKGLQVAWNKGKKCPQFAGENNPMYGTESPIKGKKRYINEQGKRYYK